MMHSCSTASRTPSTSTRRTPSASRADVLQPPLRVPQRADPGRPAQAAGRGVPAASGRRRTSARWSTRSPTPTCWWRCRCRSPTCSGTACRPGRSAPTWPAATRTARSSGASVNPLEGRKALDLMERQVEEFDAQRVQVLQRALRLRQAVPVADGRPEYRLPGLREGPGARREPDRRAQGRAARPAADRAHPDLGHGRRGGQLPRHQLRHLPRRAAVHRRDLLAADPVPEPVRLARGDRSTSSSARPACSPRSSASCCSGAARTRSSTAREAPILHPQWALRAFMDFEIPQDLCDGYGYPQLTDQAKRKILGENLLRLHGMDVAETRARLAWQGLTDKARRLTWQPLDSLRILLPRVDHPTWVETPLTSTDSVTIIVLSDSQGRGSRTGGATPVAGDVRTGVVTVRDVSGPSRSRSHSPTACWRCAPIATGSAAPIRWKIARAAPSGSRGTGDAASRTSAIDRPHRGDLDGAAATALPPQAVGGWEPHRAGGLAALSVGGTAGEAP